ncbi:uncharacterized protein [Anas acuta]|uniref:uncharacterized protein n=1 Tax=Anas acuta TaxID=28680 RepID=UPI0035C93A6A
MRKGQPKETGEDAQPRVQRNACKAATSPPSAGDKAVGMKPCSPTEPKEKLILLEVPPVNTEPGRRHLDGDEMEEIGKRSRESRRLEKIKDSPIEWKEKCRLVRSGDAPVDEHCLPSTIEGDMGALVDRYRRNAVVNYLNCSKQCKERNICLTDKALQRGLLHPGDKIIKEGEDVRKIRQPGGYYSTGHADATSPLSMSRSKSASGKQAKEAENRLVQRGLMISPFLLPCCASAPTASEAVLRYQSGTLGCCKVAASDSRGREISSQLHGHCCVFADLRGCSGAGEQLLCTPNCRDDRTSHLRRSLSGQPNASWKSSQRMFFLA